MTTMMTMMPMPMMKMSGSGSESGSEAFGREVGAGAGADTQCACERGVMHSLFEDKGAASRERRGLHATAIHTALDVMSVLQCNDA